MNTKLWIKSLLLIGFILFTPFEISAKKEKKPFKWEWMVLNLEIKRLIHI